MRTVRKIARQQAWAVGALSCTGAAAALCDAAADAKPDAEADILKDFLPPKVAQVEELKNPGQFERVNEDVRRMTQVPSQACFEGARFDLAKPLNPWFIVKHSCWLGGSTYPNTTAQYQLCTTVANDDRVILANVDHAGTVEAQVFAQAGKHLGGKLIFQLPAERKGDTVMADVDYNADTWSGQLKYGNNLQGRAGTSVGGTYLQSVTPRLSLGGEGMCYLGEPSTQLTFAGRYATPNYAATAMLANGLPMPSGPGNALIAYYHRKVSPGRVNLGAELTVFPKNLESTVAFGAEFNLKQSKLTTSVDGTGKVCSVLEATVGTGAKLTLTAEVNLNAKDPMAGPSAKPVDQYRFGYGLALGGQ